MEMQRVQKRLSPEIAIILGAMLLGACLLAQPLLSPYDVKISGGAVVRTNRLTGEVVVCNRRGCFKIINGGSFQ